MDELPDTSSGQSSAALLSKVFTWCKRIILTYSFKKKEKRKKENKKKKTEKRKKPRKIGNGNLCEPNITENRLGGNEIW